MTTMRPSMSLAAFALLASGCALFGGGNDLPERIVAERGGFIPEGIEFDTNDRRILTGSLVDGTIYEVRPDGTLAAFVVDPDLVSSIGIEADEPRDRLLVANSDRSVFGGQGPGVAKLGVYRLSTGEKLEMIDLGRLAGGDADAIVFVNDLTVDAAGNVFLTDTFRNVIYRVDPSYQATLLYRFEPTTDLGLNGIVHHVDGYLIVAALGTQGVLYKVPVADPQSAMPIALSQPATGADGLVWDAAGRLIVVSNSTGSALAYVSDDDWETATLDGTASFEGQATTGAAVDDAIYVVQPHFSDAEPPVILRVRP
jgi:sugar lactone lactonase YvrE